jgi:hypothetical protein
LILKGVTTGRGGKNRPKQRYLLPICYQRRLLPKRGSGQPDLT